MITLCGLDTPGEVRRALKTLSVAVVVDEDASTVRPHLHVPPPPDSATKRDVSGLPSLKQVQDMHLESKECERVKETGVKHLLLSHYRNQLLHWFVPDAMLALSLSLSGSCEARISK